MLNQICALFEELAEIAEVVHESPHEAACWRRNAKDFASGAYAYSVAKCERPADILKEFRQSKPKTQTRKDPHEPDHGGSWVATIQALDRAVDPVVRAWVTDNPGQVEPMKKSLLNSSGRIPSHTECPFRKDCTIAKQNECKHEGLKHSVPFSCGAARLHDTIHRYETQAKK